MIKWHALWAVASFGLAFGINAKMAPELEFVAEAPDLGVGSGTLTLEQPEGEHVFELVEIRVLARDVERTFGPVLRVRELLLRSPRQDADTPPDVVLYADFAATGEAPISENAREVSRLRDRELPLLPSPVGRDARSRLRLPGSSQALAIESGTLSLTDAVELPDDEGAAAFRVSGVLVVQPEGDVEAMTGEFRARMLWE